MKTVSEYTQQSHYNRIITCVEDSGRMRSLHFAGSPQYIYSFTQVRLHRVVPLRPVGDGRVGNDPEMGFFVVDKVNGEVKSHLREKVQELEITKVTRNKKSLNFCTYS